MPRYIDASRFAGTDDERLAKAFKEFVRDPGSTLDLSRKAWRLTRPLTVGPGPNGQVSGRIVGSPLWHNVEFAGPDASTGAPGRVPVFEFVEAKDLVVDGLSVRADRAGGLAFKALSSSSRLTLRNCRVQGGPQSQGFLFEDAGDGADVSRVHLVDCEAHGCGSGVKFAGPNALDPRLTGCSFSHCGIGVDLRTGGSNAVLDIAGGSYCDTLLAVNGGYQIGARVQSAEHCGTVFRTGGDDAGGYGQPGYQRFYAMEVRACTGPWLAANRSGETVATVDRFVGKAEVSRENRSATPARLVLEAAAAQSRVASSQGLWLE